MNINISTNAIAKAEKICRNRMDALNASTNSGANKVLSENKENSCDKFEINHTPEQNTQNVPSSENQDKSDNITSYSESITMESGKQTNYSLELNGKLYYFENVFELELAKLAEDESTFNFVGVARIETQWGQRTNYFIEAEGSKWYFNSRADLVRASILTVDEMKKMAVGRFPSEYTGGEEIKNNDAAIVDLEGSQSKYYIDVDNTRYYYNSLPDMIRASIANDPSVLSCGKAEVMVSWGTETDFYIDLNGSRYFFKNETDKQAAQDILENDYSVFGMLSFNKLVVGKCKISK